MSAQYIVAVFLDGTLTVDATGPYRSKEKADAVCDKLNGASEWSDGGGTATIVAQTVLLSSVDEILDAMVEPDLNRSDKGGE